MPDTGSTPDLDNLHPQAHDTSLALDGIVLTPIPQLPTLSTRELLKEFRASNNALHKEAALNLIKARSPHITHLFRSYSLAETTEVLRHVAGADPLTNQFVAGPEVPVGKFFALTTKTLPAAATVEILEEAMHLPAPKPAIAVARVKIVAVVSPLSKSRIGQIAWTSRTNISAAADPQGLFKVIKPDANIREEPVFVKGKRTLAPGRRVFIDEIKIDDFKSRNTFGLAVDADTLQDHGWIRTTALAGKLDSEVFGLREPLIISSDTGHKTVGGQAATVLSLKGQYYTVQEGTFAKNTPVMILREADHQGPKGLTRVAELQGANGVLLGWTTRTNVSKQPAANGFFTITAANANIRNNPLPVYATGANLIPQGALVQVVETAGAVIFTSSGQVNTVSVSKVTVMKNGKKDPKFENVWTHTANLVDNWADYKGPNALWNKGNYLGQTALLDVIGELGNGGRQIAMTGGLGAKVEQMLQDAKRDNIPLSINSGFRDYKKQEQLARDQPSNAAKPGRSDHQAGNSVDLNNKDNKQVFEWLRHNAWKYGLVQTYPWFLGTDGKGGEGHHWDYRPELAKEGFYTYFLDRFNPGVVFGTEPGQVDPRVKSTETWLTGNPQGRGKGNFRIIETATGKAVKLRKH